MCSGELWGTPVNGTWNGLVGLLDREGADIGVADVFLTLDRNEVIDYSAPYDMKVMSLKAQVSLLCLLQGRTISSPFTN